MPAALPRARRRRARAKLAAASWYVSAARRARIFKTPMRHFGMAAALALVTNQSVALYAEIREQPSLQQRASSFKSHFASRALAAVRLSFGENDTT